MMTLQPHQRDRAAIRAFYGLSAAKLNVAETALRGGLPAQEAARIARMLTAERIAQLTQPAQAPA